MQVLHGKVISELRPGVTCHMETHNITCHPTPLDLPTLEGWKAELTKVT